MTQRFSSQQLRSTLGLAIALPLLALTACASNSTTTEADSETTEATAETSAEPVKMALVLSGSSNDQSWDQAAFEAGEDLKAEGVEVAVSEAVDPANAAGVLRQYASEGYDLIVAHSFSYQDAVFEVAQEFPDVNFAWAGGIDGTAENVADYDQPFYQGAYLVGLVA
ncbi:MAG: BMP family ABC transporter substrate-binding protein, partial [Phormidesmis sp.]